MIEKDIKEDFFHYLSQNRYDLFGKKMFSIINNINGSFDDKIKSILRGLEAIFLDEKLAQIALSNKIILFKWEETGKHLELLEFLRLDAIKIREKIQNFNEIILCGINKDGLRAEVIRDECF